LAEEGRKAEEKFQGAAEYLRNADFKAIGDVHGIMKRYSGASLARLRLSASLLLTPCIVAILTDCVPNE
jgi:hypothetical protein